MRLFPIHPSNPASPCCVGTSTRPRRSDRRGPQKPRSVYPCPVCTITRSAHRTLLTSSGVVTLTLAPGRRRRNFPLYHYSPSFPFLPSLLSTRRPSIPSPADAAHCLRSTDRPARSPLQKYLCGNHPRFALARTLASFSLITSRSMLHLRQSD